MHINNIFQNTNHPKSILSQLKSVEGLPFEEVLSKQEIAKNLQNRHFRNRIYPLDVTLWAFLTQVLSDDQSCQSTVAHVIAFFASKGKEIPSANTAAYCKARSRLPEEIISNLAKESARQIEEQVPPQWLWRGKHIRLIDGSTLFMPDTLENQAAYPQSKVQKPGLGFPIARIVTVISYVTGAILDAEIGGCFGKGAGEHGLLRQLMHVFKPGDVALGDCYYASFFLVAALIQMQVDVIFPIHSGRHHDFRKGKSLGKRDHIVEWQKPQRPKWMSLEEYNEFPNKISIRETKINEEKKGFRTKSRIIVTTFLDSKSVSKYDLKTVYDYRWSVGVSREGHYIQSVKVRPRLKRLKPRSLGGIMARKQDDEALRQHTQKGVCAIHQVVTHSNADVASLHEIRWLRRSITRESKKSCWHEADTTTLTGGVSAMTWCKGCGGNWRSPRYPAEKFCRGDIYYNHDWEM